MLFAPSTQPKGKHLLKDLSKTMIDHIQITIKTKNPNQEPLVSSEAPIGIQGQGCSLQLQTQHRGPKSGILIYQRSLRIHK